MNHKDHWLLPEGIREILPDEASRLESLRRELLDLFSSWGYELVIPPFVDYLDSLLTGTGHDLDLKTFKVTDQVSGRMLGIRADMTPQVARMDAHTLKSDHPSRLCYIGTVLHTLGHPMEQTRSPLQIGAELYGHDGIASDVEVIRLMLEMLAQAGIANVHLDLGHVGIFRALAEQGGIDADQEALLFDILQRKAIPELEVFLSEQAVDQSVAGMLLALANLNGDSSVLDKAVDVLTPASDKVKVALDNLCDAAKQLQQIFPHLPIHFDLAELRGYHYQTGLVFAAFVPGLGKEIARGGRYDDIGQIFGRARPATGFSADLKVLLLLSELENDASGQARIYAPAEFDSALHELVRKLRLEGKIVIETLPGSSSTARDMGCGQKISKINSQWVIVPVEA